jgi:Protein phosphatase 2C
MPNSVTPESSEPPRGAAWKLLFQSVRGTAHERSGQPCQDRCLARIKRMPHGPVLLLACADGAGSARFAEIGASLTCQTVLRLVRQDLAEGLQVAAIERDTALSWLVRVRSLLEQQATLLQTELGQLACTLLLTVVGEDAVVFVQIGDGAMVFRQGPTYQPVFWPQTGEYANTTLFVTDPDYDVNLAFELRRERIDELGLFSDGLQMLALHYASRSAHQPFFHPMFERLRAAKPGERLPEALRQFLTSAAVTARSDDDKTLILATRQ